MSFLNNFTYNNTTEHITTIYDAPNNIQSPLNNFILNCQEQAVALKLEITQTIMQNIKVDLLALIGFAIICIGIAQTDISDKLKFGFSVLGTTSLVIAVLYILLL